MRELSPDVQEQLVQQLNKVAAGDAVREAVIETMFLVAAVDGNVSPIEVAQFADGVESVCGAEADGDADALVKRMAARLDAEGWDKRVAAVKSALAGTEHADVAYRLAAAVAFVDDTIEHSEAAALDSLAKALGVTDERAHELMAEVRAELFD